MAAISAIRKRAGLIVLITFLALAMFVLMDTLGSQSAIFGGVDPTIGKVAGNKLSIDEFEKRVQKETDDFKFSRNLPALDAATMEELREEVWNKMIDEWVLGSIYEKLGIRITDRELEEMVYGSTPHPSIQQAFTDPKTGRFDPSSIHLFMQQRDKEPSGEAMRRWLLFEKSLIEEELSQKYKNILRNGIFVPSWQAKEDYLARNRKATIDFIFIGYHTVNDTAVAVTEKDIQEYLKKHGARYRQKNEIRKIEYVAFEVIPTAEDSLRVQEELLKLNEEFKQADNDSLFIALHSDRPFDEAYYTYEQLSLTLRDTLFTLMPGEVIGPFLENNAYQLAKLIDRKKTPDSVKARHILIAASDPLAYEAARKRIDTIKQQIETGASFEQLAKEKSDDPGSKEKGGDLGWVKPGQMVRNFNNAVFFKGKKGDRLVVETEFGVHLVEILEATPSKEAVQVAYLAREVTASDATINKAYAEAAAVAAASRNSKEFAKTVLDKDLTVRIAESIRADDRNIRGLQESRSIVRWAYNAKIGDVSEVIELEDRFIVATLTKVVRVGEIDIEMHRQEIENEVRKMKKAALIIEDIRKKAPGATTLQAIAEKLNQPVQHATVTFANAFLPGAGRELKAIGTVFALRKGQLSEPIRGENGVILLIVTAFEDPPAEQNYSMNVRQLSTSLRSRIEFSLKEVLRQQAGLVDQRYKFF